MSSIFNLKASNTVNLRTGLRNVINQTADAAIVAQGDSTDRAKGAGLGTDFQNGWLPQLARLLRSNGFVPYATWDSLIGTGNMIPGDDRWASTGTTTTPASIGGSMWQADASGEGLTFTPVEPKNAYGLLHFDNNSMRFNARVNAETPLVVDGTTGTRFALLTTTSPGPHVITIAWEASAVRFMGIDAYDSAVKQLKFWNASVSGARLEAFFNETQQYAAGSMSKFLSGVACCAIGGCGKNEMRIPKTTDPDVFTTPAEYATNLATWVDNWRFSGTCDPLLHTPVPDADDGSFAYPLSDYIAKIYEVALVKDVPVVRVNEALGGSWAIG
ncbi:hypothetical protein, partial [Bosea sp. (in: a-proteobacteria)]|uniref:hypothetical protein n=1 Tax=Bosea sp. (in: a-proteobacteria) TaxID=1871050 RepID=UPI0027336DB4